MNDLSLLALAMLYARVLFVQVFQVTQPLKRNGTRARFPARRVPCGFGVIGRYHRGIFLERRNQFGPIAGLPYARV